MSALPPLTSGLRIGDVVLGEELGRGAQGVVFAGTDAAGRSLALKFILLEDETQAARAEREALALARVDRHPHILRLHAVTRWGPYLVLVMERVDAPDLAARLEAQGALGEREAAGLLAPIAEALAFIHAQGLTHRDVKPANILLREDERGPLLSDFGLARGVGLQTLTHTQDMIGTPAYMAPEQFDRSLGEVGPAADVWALCVVFVELITGEPPFRAASTVELMAKILDASGSGSGSGRWSRALSRPARQVVVAGLRSDPGQRPSAGRLADQLRALGQGRPRTRHQGALGFASVLVIAGLIVGYVGLGLSGLQEEAEGLADLATEQRDGWYGAALLSQSGYEDEEITAQLESARRVLGEETQAGARDTLTGLRPRSLPWRPELAHTRFTQACEALRGGRSQEASVRFHEVARRWPAVGELGSALAALQRGAFEEAEGRLAKLSVKGLEARLQGLRREALLGPALRALEAGDGGALRGAWERARLAFADTQDPDAALTDRLQLVLDGLDSVADEVRAFRAWEVCLADGRLRDPGPLEASAAAHEELSRLAEGRHDLSWLLVHLLRRCTTPEHRHLVERHIQSYLYAWATSALEVAPNDPRDVYRSCWRLAHEGVVVEGVEVARWLEARGVVDEAIERDADDPTARLLRGEFRLLRGAWESAREPREVTLRDLEQAARGAESRGWRHLRANALATLGGARQRIAEDSEAIGARELEDIAVQLKEALELGCADPVRARLDLAWCAESLHRHRESFQILDLAEQEASSWRAVPPPWLTSGELLSAGEGTHPSLSEVRARRLRAQLELGDSADALALAAEQWERWRSSRDQALEVGIILSEVLVGSAARLGDRALAKDWLDRCDAALGGADRYQRRLAPLREQLR